MREAVGRVPDDQGKGGTAVLPIAGQTGHLYQARQAAAGISGA